LERNNTFLDPKYLASLSSLELVARTVIDGFMIGGNRSFNVGAGLEFNQYRSYQPGDDLKLLDWKMYSRSDKYFVREAQVETSINLRFILDGSKSMQYKEEVSKQEYASFIIASLAYLGKKQADGIGLDLVSEKNSHSIPCSRDPQQFHRILYALEQLKIEGKLPAEIEFIPGKKELILFISDFYESNKEVNRFLNASAAYGNEIIAIHVIGQKEKELDFKGNIVFRDLESGSQVHIDADKMRDSYQKEFIEFLNRTEKAFSSEKIFYHQAFLNEPVDKFLRRMLKSRISK
jgi:uncharacterized protein (DUF58 family)